MTLKIKIPFHLKTISWVLTVFTATMVLFSFFNPTEFYKSYGIEGTIPFQMSWSYRYTVILVLMIIGNLFGRPETIFISVTGRFGNVPNIVVNEQILSNFR